MDIKQELKRGYEALKAEEYECAIEHFDKILFAEPNHTRARLDRTECIFKLIDKAKELWDGNTNDEALKIYDKVIELDPGNRYHYDEKADCLLNAGKIKEYLYFLDFIVRKFPQDEYAISTIYYAVGSISNFKHVPDFIFNAMNKYPEYQDFYLLLQKHYIAARERIEKKDKYSSRCYIATVCYGSYDCTQVMTLRNFRDEYLSQTFAGRVFIKIYYALSPSVAKWLKNKHNLNTFIRKNLLDSIYDFLKKKY